MMNRLQQNIHTLAGQMKMPVSRQEAKTIAEKLGTILHFASAMQDLPTENVVPMRAVVFTPQSLRDDAVHPSLSTAAVKANAPAWSQGHFVVPHTFD